MSYLEIDALNVIRLHTHLAKILVAVMLWTGLTGSFSVGHARALKLAPPAVTKINHRTQHIADHTDHGHNGGMARTQDGAPIGDSDCLQFCTELLDTPAVLKIVAERPTFDLVKNLVPRHAEHYVSGILVAIKATSTSATGPPFGLILHQYATGLSALLARNHRLRV